MLNKSLCLNSWAYGYVPASSSCDEEQTLNTGKAQKNIDVIITISTMLRHRTSLNLHTGGTQAVMSSHDHINWGLFIISLMVAQFT